MACQDVCHPKETETETETESQSQSRRQVNPKSKICCGRNISRTHCHRGAVDFWGHSGSSERRVSSTFRIEMSFWLALEFFIANCWQEREPRGACGGGSLPRAAIFLEGPAQMSHQSCVQRCVRSKEKYSFCFFQGHEGALAPQTFPKK